MRVNCRRWISGLRGRTNRNRDTDRGTGIGIGIGLVVVYCVVVWLFGQLKVQKDDGGDGGFRDLEI
ncbi:hypothetical protein CC80DRAFT_494930 [Byssothecium circinans]|uniref:Uncharacterized protein n=1 Tax=Byssothecium circinans TaxID=147558 RepID=A0A6A5TK89_9PLEO|nr:hypothetical protein CC80DRAFT_494930 [Byssothecium circinans]